TVRLRSSRTVTSSRFTRPSNQCRCRSGLGAQARRSALSEATTMNLKSAESAINGASLTGLVIGILTLIQTVVVLFLNGDLRGEAVVAFGSIAILFALSYGVWRKNKICAILLALYFLSLFAWMTASWIQ